MLAAIELTTLTTETCPACGQVHQLRAALAADDGSSTGALLGFFARCPAAARRVWLVVRVPAQTEGPARLLRMGPPDELDWEPDPVDGNERIASLRGPAGRPSTQQLPSTRGRLDGGFRGNTRTPELLRRAFGCPHSSALP